MNESRSKQIEPWQQEDAARLYALFKQYATMSQMAFGAAYEIGNQSMVSQYLLGKRPLNIEAAKKFSLGLGRPIDEFSPTLAKRIAEASERIDQDAPEADHAPIRLVDAKASAGKGEIVFSDDITKVLMFRRDWLAKNDAKPDQTIGFEVAGDSMADLHIIDGSVVLANRRRTDPLSKRVYVVWINGKLYVKELVKKDGMWWARSHNAARAADYPDILIDDPAARIVGRAFWCGFGL